VVGAKLDSLEPKASRGVLPGFLLESQSSPWHAELHEVLQETGQDYELWPPWVREVSLASQSLCAVTDTFALSAKRYLQLQRQALEQVAILAITIAPVQVMKMARCLARAFASSADGETSLLGMLVWLQVA